MKSVIFSVFFCPILLFYGEICNAQPVANIESSTYPDNVLKVPVYHDSGTINVQLSEIAETNVNVTCRSLSVDAGFSNITFQNGIIQANEQRGTITFDIISAGRVTEVQCSAQSISGTQFLTASSTGKIGYIQVTSRPIVSLCSDVVVVPMMNPVRIVEVVLSERVVNDSVTVHCSVVSPLRNSSARMMLRFNATSVPVPLSGDDVRKVNISYVLANDNHTDPVIVGCWAWSDNTTTPPENLQYTRDTSQGETAVFMYQVPQATFVPASIRSLGRTTLAHTVSYLVLESPAKDVTKFVCAFSNNSENPPCATGSLSVTSVDLNSVTVELITTNMTFEIGDSYKPLIVQVNGSSTQRDQRLLEVTCCRKNVDPKYFVLATTLHLWIDVYPSVQFDWENITELFWSDTCENGSLKSENILLKFGNFAGAALLLGQWRSQLDS